MCNFRISGNLSQRVESWEHLRERLLHIVEVHSFAALLPIEGCVTVLQGTVLVHRLVFRLRHLGAVLGRVVHGLLQSVLQDAA